MRGKEEVVDETSAMVTGIIWIGAHGIFAVGGIILLTRRVWDLAVSALTVGLGIPGLVLLIGYTGIVTNWWQLILAIFALMCLAWESMSLLLKFFPRRPTAPMAS